MALVKILLVGDLIGKAGRRAIARFLPALRAEYNIDFIIANVENASGGFGLNRKNFDEIMAAGVDCATSGNHIFDREEVLSFIDKDPRLLRPGNYGEKAAGRCAGVYETTGGVTIGVLNVSGMIFMKSAENSFHLAKREVEALRNRCNLVIVDFHAEATSEKNALAWYLDGRATAVIGTHTHIPTADARILPQGLAFMTDVGMTGGYDSVIGIRVEKALVRFVEEGQSAFEVSKKNIQLHGALITADPITGKAVEIEHVVRHLPAGQ